MENLMAVREVAQKLCLTEAAIRNYVLKKKIPCYKIGGAVRFGKQEIEEWVKSDCPAAAVKVIDQGRQADPAADDGQG